MAIIDTAESTPTITFPDGFGWGTATASYQIEGAVDVDGRSPSVWDVFSHTPGMITDGSNGDRADDHYRRWADDVAIMADLGVNFYRFSLAWPRLQPDGRGELNAAGLDFYARLVDGLLERGITPWVTLYHWDLPQVLEDAGGWPERDTAYRFADYSDRVFARLGDRVRHWTTLNEPFCAGLLSYAAGVLAPGRHEPIAGIRAVHHLLLGHGLALDALRPNSTPQHEFGLTLNLSPVSPATDSEADVDAARRIDALANRLFLDPVLTGSYPADLIEDLEPLTGFDHVRDGDLEHIGQPIDLLGVNYYMPYLVKAGAGHKYHNTGYVGAGDVDFVATGPPDHGPRLGDRSRRPLPVADAPRPRLPRPTAVDHRERGRVRRPARRRRRGSRPGPDRLSRRPLPGCAPSDPRWRRPARLLHLDPDGQLRVVLRRIEPLRTRPCRLRHAAPDPKDSAHWFAAVTARNGLEARST